MSEKNEPLVSKWHKELELFSGIKPLLILEGKTMKQVANFVYSKLSPIEYVTGTATHFIMKRYKDFGTVLGKVKKDVREKMSV